MSFILKLEFLPFDCQFNSEIYLLHLKNKYVTKVSRNININNGELMLIQDYVFNKVLITHDELRE